MRKHEKEYIMEQLYVETYYFQLSGMKDALYYGENSERYFRSASKTSFAKTIARNLDIPNDEIEKCQANARADAVHTFHLNHDDGQRKKENRDKVLSSLIATIHATAAYNDLIIEVGQIDYGINVEAPDVRIVQELDKHFIETGELPENGEFIRAKWPDSGHWTYQSIEADSGCGILEDMNKLLRRL